MKITVLVLILTAASTTAFFTGKIYLLLAGNMAQAIAAQRSVVEGARKSVEPQKFDNPRIY